MTKPKFNQYDLDIQKLNSTLERIGDWIDLHEKASEKRNERIISIELEDAKFRSKQTVINALLSAVGGSVLTLIIMIIGKVIQVG